MITLKEKQTIIKLYLEGVSEREISKRTKKARNTVRKYIKQYEKGRHEDVNDLPITEEVMKQPSYKKRKGKKKVLTEEIKGILRGYIKANVWKKNHYMKKQQMKMIDMHEELLDAGFIISYTTVWNFVNSETAKTKEVFIRRHCEPGHEAEFDWGELKLEIDGAFKTYNLAVFTLPYSNYRFAKIYESQSMICVLDVHVEFINHVGFIPKVFTYDNMRTVVKAFIGTERKITDSMINLSNYYQFDIRLCQPRKGNEKGHVERSVEFIRRKAFSTIHSFNNLKEAEVHLLTTLERINNRNHYEHKAKHHELMKNEAVISSPAITPFDASDMVEVRVDKYSTVVINQNHYSVPEGNVGKYIKAKVGAKNIKLFIDGQLEAMHIRNWGVHQWVMDINHFLKTFQRKKGAIAQSECLRQAPTQIKNIYYQHYIGKEKEFLELLLYVKENDNLNQVLEAIKDLENIRLDYVSTERILFICEQSLPTESATTRRDDTINQSESNMIAYTKMFGQLKEVASS
ncbi:IS21 family transposase [Siminovitchia fortis]|nr:IS21 family transposase [Siminovitchia fortis]WHY80673.1 IS21 family transposase [Siminovitchia fortis]WHY82409.1 IS21 family transposase [Siminovitchia fortis]